MPKKKLIEQYSNQDIDYMFLIGGMILYEIMPTMYTDKQRMRLMKNLNCFNLIKIDPDKTREMFGKQFSEIDEAVYDNVPDDLDYAIANNPGKDPEEVKEVFEDTRNKQINHNSNNLFYSNDDKELSNVILNDLQGTRSQKIHYTNPLIDKPIKLMIKTVKEISSDLGRYIKDESYHLADYEMEFLNGLKMILDDLADGKGVTHKFNTNPVYFYVLSQFTNGFALDRPTCVYEPNKKTGEYEFAIRGISGIRKKVEWQTIINRNFDNGVIHSVLAGVKLTRLYDSYLNDGDADREQLLAGYENFAAEMSKVLSMTEEQYEAVKRTLGTGYVDFAGDRAPRFVLDDAEAHISLIKAGYPVSDMSVMAQYYTVLQKCKQEADKSNSEQLKEQYNSMNELWNTAISRKSVDKAFRDDMLQKMADSIVKLTPIIGGYEKLADKLLERKNASLTATDVAELDNSPKVLYKLIDKADPIYISSSDQFKSMKEALEKLSKIDKEKDPAGYELWRDRAIERTEKYMKFKTKQLHDPKEKHSRSNLEIKRVKSANAVLKGLKTMRKKDMDDSLAKDKRHLVEVNLPYKLGKEFIAAQNLLYRIRSEMLKELNAIKAVLVNSQKSAYANFENEATEGSAEYRRMTQSLEKSINVLNNDNASPNDVVASIVDFHSAAKNYHKEKEGIIFGPQSGSGQTRFTQSELAITTFPLLIQVHENARRKFENFRDAEGNSYMQKPYGVIDEISDDLIERYKDDPEMKRDFDTWDFDGMYVGLKETSELQLGVSNVIKSKNAFMGENYASNNGKDYYTAVNRDMSVSDMAKNYITKQYLDRLYHKDITKKDVYAIADEINAGELERRSSELAGNVVFKAVAKKYPEKLFSEWDRIEKKADRIQGMCGDNLNSLHRGVNKRFNSDDEYINAQEGRENQINAAAFATVNRMMATVGDKTTRLIAQSLAADPSVDPKAEIERLTTVAAKYLDEQQKKTGMDINVIRKDPKVIKAIDKKILESYNTAAKQRKEAAKVKAKNVSKQAAPKAHIPS